MAAGVGNPGKDDENRRTIIVQFSANAKELEQLEWAADHLGLERAAFLRYSALQVAREVLK